MAAWPGRHWARPVNPVTAPKTNKCRRRGGLWCASHPWRLLRWRSLAGRGKWAVGAGARGKAITASNADGTGEDGEEGKRRGRGARPAETALVGLALLNVRCKKKRTGPVGRSFNAVARQGRRDCRRRRPPFRQPATGATGQSSGRLPTHRKQTDPLPRRRYREAAYPARARGKTSIKGGERPQTKGRAARIPVEAARRRRAAAKTGRLIIGASSSGFRRGPATKGHPCPAARRT